MKNPTYPFKTVLHLPNDKLKPDSEKDFVQQGHLIVSNSIHYSRSSGKLHRIKKVIAIIITYARYIPNVITSTILDSNCFSTVANWMSKLVL